MKYYIEGAGLSYANLHGGPEFPVEIRNVSITGGAVIGDILADNSGVYSKITGDADAEKDMCIAAEDVIETDTQITSAYFAGKFNIGALSFGSATPETIEKELRKQNIIITAAMEV